MTKKKADYGKGKTPGAFCVLPQRAVIDPRFKTYPNQLYPSTYRN